MPNPRRSSACDCTCVLTRIDHYSLMLAIRILFCSCLCKVRSRISDHLSQALCNLSLAFLADLTLSDLLLSYILIASLANYTLLFVWIERHDHSVYMSSILQVQQLYTAGTPFLEAYLLHMANNRTRRNERLSAASHVVQIHTHARFPQSIKMADLSYAA